MKCDLKTMLKIGLVLAVIIVGGYIAFPQFRPAIIGLAPFALFALCPISMMFMMGGKNKDHDHKSQEGSASYVEEDHKKHAPTT